MKSLLSLPTSALATAFVLAIPLAHAADGLPMRHVSG
jgi:hypothetical protein